MILGQREFAALCAALGLALIGCGKEWRSYEIGESIDRNKVEAIVPGETHRTHILEQLGPPKALLRPGKSIVIDIPSGFETLDYDSSSQRFADSSQSGMAIYYYESFMLSAERSWISNLSGQTRYFAPTTSSRERLWILIDEHTGTAVDIVFEGN